MDGIGYKEWTKIVAFAKRTELAGDCLYGRIAGGLIHGPHKIYVPCGQIHDITLAVAEFADSDRANCIAAASRP